MKDFIFCLLVSILIINFYSGVSFALQNCEIIIDTNKVVLRDGSNFITINGTIINSSTKAIVETDTRVYISGHPTYSTYAEDGQFSLIIFTTDLGVGSFSITGESNSEIAFVDGLDASFNIVPEIILSEGSDLNLDYPVTGSQVIQGEFPNQDGDDYSLALGYIANDGISMLGSPLATAVNLGDSFGFLFNGSKFNKAGDIGIFVNEVLVLQGSVSPSILNVTVSETSIPRLLGSQPITFDFNLDARYLDDDGLAEKYILRYSVTNPDDVPVLTNALLVGNGRNFSDSRNQQLTQTLSCTSWSTGTAELCIELYDTEVESILKKKVLMLDVINPSKYTLTGWEISKIALGDIKLGLPNNRSGNFPSTALDQKVEIRMYDNGGSSVCKYLELIVSGCGIEERIANYGPDADSDNVVTLSPESTGIVDITINVYSNEYDDSPNISFNKQLVILDYIITFSPTEIVAESDTDLIISVKTGDGSPVNNAVIKIGNITIFDGSSDNIVGGHYVYHDDPKRVLRTVGLRDLIVTGYQNDVLITKEIEGAINVVGEQVYNMRCNTDVLINGEKELIYITTKNSKGKIIYPEFERINIAADGTESTPEIIQESGYSDLDEDGTREAAQIRLTPTGDQVMIVIRASTDNGKRKGEIRLTVLHPIADLQASQLATENFNTNIQFQLRDPRNHEVIDKEVFFLGNYEYLDYSLFDYDGDEIPVEKGQSHLTLPNPENIYMYTLFVNDVDWDKAIEDEVTPTIDLYIKNGNIDVKVAEIPIKAPSFNAKPDMLKRGIPVDVTLTYTDGAGNPLGGYDVKLGWSSIGQTDENGQLIYSTKALSRMVFKAATEDEYYNDSYIYNQHENNNDPNVIELTLQPDVDDHGPMATAPQSVSTNNANITISDSSGIAQLEINGVPISTSVTEKEIIYAVPVNEGVNSFIIDATDNYGNSSTTTLEVKYTRNAVNTTSDNVTFIIGQSSIYGIPELHSGTTTMVPVRFAESLGAFVEWDGNTKTATYSIDDKVISVTIGQSYAIINGAKLPLDKPAYINALGRTFVPLRMIANELGFKVIWTSNNEPISIVKK